MSVAGLLEGIRYDSAVIKLNHYVTTYNYMKLTACYVVIYQLKMYCTHYKSLIQSGTLMSELMKSVSIVTTLNS